MRGSGRVNTFLLDKWKSFVTDVPAGMTYYLFKYLPILLLVAPVAVWGYMNLRTTRQARILLIVCGALGCAITALVTAGAIAQIPHDQWSASRLAPSIAWVKGYRMYYGPGEGPALVRMYGPVPWILYAPSALLGTPTLAMLAATVLNLVCFALPVVWLFWVCCHESTRVERFAGLALFGVIAVFSRPLHDSLFAVSIDGPAIGFAAATCAVVIGARDIGTLRTGMLAGFFASLSVWSKQTMWPFVLAPVIYAFLTQRQRAALRFAAIFVLVIVVISMLLLLAFGWREMLFNMYTIPSRHPCQWASMDRASALMRATKLIARESALPGVLLAAGLLLRRGWRERNFWFLLVLSAVLVIPTTALAYAKVAGRANNAAPEVYLLVLAGVIALLRNLHASADSLSRVHRLAVLFVTGLLLAIPLAHWREFRRLPEQLAGWGRLSQNDNELAFRHSRAHPNEVYFPQNPFASLFADGRADHAEAAVADLHLAGMSLSREQLEIGLPENLRAVAYHGASGGLMIDYLPEFRFPTTTPELPRWTLFERDKRSNGPTSTSHARAAAATTAVRSAFARHGS